MSGLALSLLLHTTLVGETADYAQAYRQTEADGRPLLVLVGADWCPGCRTMKHAVLPSMSAGGNLRDVNLAIVNIDEEDSLAERLMRGGTIPQLIIFSKTKEGWKREQITGAADAASVTAMIHRALAGSQTTRTVASSNGEGATGN